MDQIRLVIEPIKKKWIYHFIVSSKTNLLGKPEWYLNQTLKWIYEHIDTVESKVKLEQSNDGTCDNVRHKFILCMVELAMIRLSKDMKEITAQLDDPEDCDNAELILIHTYNEVIQFSRVILQLLSDCYAKLEEPHDLLSVFSQQQLFERIIDVEWDCAEKNLKAITSATNKWSPVLEGEFVDNYKIPKCVDRLLMLTRSITERVECFKQLDCQFKLVELQCFLFNKFLTFLNKSTESSPASMNILSDILFFNQGSTIDLSRILCILNGVNFLRLILKEKHFIPNDVINNLDSSLIDKSNKIAQDYKTCFYDLVEKVIGIYEYADCDLKTFLNFTEPKLSHHIFEIIKDEASRIHQERHTQNLLQGLSIKGKNF